MTIMLLALRKRNFLLPISPSTLRQAQHMSILLPREKGLIRPFLKRFVEVVGWCAGFFVPQGFDVVPRLPAEHSFRLFVVELSVRQIGQQKERFAAGSQSFFWHLDRGLHGGSTILPRC